jgi:hypothetical protein
MPMFKRDAIFQSLILYGPILVGAWVSLLIPRFNLIGSIVFTAYVIGVSIFLYAKVCEKIRSKQLVSFGPGRMSRSEKTLYFSGYVLLTCGTVLLIAVNIGII